MGRDPWVTPILSAANFIIGIGAFLVIGMLTSMMQDLQITPARAGRVMTFYALAYAIFSPLLVALTGGSGGGGFWQRG